MEIYVGARVRVNKKGMSTDSSDKKAWYYINTTLVDQVKHMKYLTVTEILGPESFRVQGNFWDWPADMFEVIPEEGYVVLSREEKGILKELLQSRVDTYNSLLLKLT